MQELKHKCDCKVLSACPSESGGAQGPFLLLQGPQKVGCLEPRALSAPRTSCLG